MNSHPSWTELVGGRVLVRSTKPPQPYPIEMYVLEVSPTGKRIHAHMSLVGTASWIEIDAIELVEVLPSTPTLRETLKSWEILTELRTYSREVCITLMSDDEDEGHGSYLVVEAPWTSDEGVQYYGDTILRALELAKEDMDAYVARYGK